MKNNKILFTINKTFWASKKDRNTLTFDVEDFEVYLSIVEILSSLDILLPASPPQVEAIPLQASQKFSISCFSRAANIYIRFICKQTLIEEVNIKVIVTVK